MRHEPEIVAELEVVSGPEIVSAAPEYMKAWADEYVDIEASRSAAVDAPCPVCLIEHDRETHAATLRVHRWFRGVVAASLVTPKPGKRGKGAARTVSGKWTAGIE